jgi:hypothetical protein
MIAPHPMVVLEMADHRLDGGAATHLAANDFGERRRPGRTPA